MLCDPRSLSVGRGDVLSILRQGSRGNSPTSSCFRGHGRLPVPIRVQVPLREWTFRQSWFPAAGPRPGARSGPWGRKPWVSLRGRKLPETTWELRSPPDQIRVHSTALVHADVWSRGSGKVDLPPSLGITGKF